MRKRNFHPYDDEVITKEELHEDRIFRLESAMEYVIDDYDPYIGSVELSHHERLDYFEVTSFSEKDEKGEILDLRWMNDNDVVNIKRDSVANNCVKDVLININNLDCSHFSSSVGFGGLRLIVFNKSSQYNPINKIRVFQNFICSHRNVIDSIDFVGFNPVMKAILEKYADRIMSEEEKTLKKI